MDKASQDCEHKNVGNKCKRGTVKCKPGNARRKQKPSKKSVAGAIMEEKSSNPTQRKYDEKRLRENKWEAKNMCKHRMKKKNEKITKKRTRKHRQQIEVRKTAQWAQRDEDEA